jgi:putative intracellular protease/amidase
MHLVPDAALKDIDPSTFDLVVVPGGLGGAKVMRESHLVGEVLKSFESRGKLISAICACMSRLIEVTGAALIVMKLPLCCCSTASRRAAR